MSSYFRRRRQARARRWWRRQRRKAGEGLQLVFGVPQAAAMLALIVVLGISLLFWNRLEMKNRLFGAPSSADWEAMSQAVMHRDLKRCDDISPSATLWTPSEFPTLPLKTLRDECRARILGSRRVGPPHYAPLQPSPITWPHAVNRPVFATDMNRQPLLPVASMPSGAVPKDFPELPSEKRLDVRQQPLIPGSIVEPPEQTSKPK